PAALRAARPASSPARPNMRAPSRPTSPTTAPPPPKCRQSVVRPTPIAFAISSIEACESSARADSDSFSRPSRPSLRIPAPSLTCEPSFIRENTTSGTVMYQFGTIVSQFRRASFAERSEEHTSELQSRFDVVCRLLLEKKKYTAESLLQTAHPSLKQQSA